MTSSNPYVGAYPWLTNRAGVWREIVRFVSNDVSRAQIVLELGAGYCDFINNFPAPIRIAFDLNPEMSRFAAPGVDLRVGDCRGLPGIEADSVDLVFASNFLEHFTIEEAAAAAQTFAAKPFNGDGIVPADLPQRATLRQPREQCCLGRREIE